MSVLECEVITNLWHRGKLRSKETGGKLMHPFRIDGARLA